MARRSLPVGRPRSKVTVLENATAVAATTANANGDWSLVTEHKFASANPQINFSIGDGSEIKTSDAPVALDSISPPSRQEVPAATASPSVRLLKEFEGAVATAREEAKQRDSAASSVKDGAVKGPASTTPSVEVVTQTQPQVAKGSPSSEHGPDSSRSSSTTTAVPMTFVYDEATLTPEGRRATRLLLEYLILKKFSAVTLSGHADERGSPDFNMELSRQNDSSTSPRRGVPRQDRLVAKRCDRAVPWRRPDSLSARRTHAAGSPRRTPRCKVEILQLNSAHSLHHFPKRKRQAW